MPLRTRHHLAVEERQDGDRCVLMPAGELDLFTVPDLTRALRTCERRARTLVLDLSRVRFLDSAGIGLLLAQHRRAQKGGTSFSITNPHGEVRRVLEISGVERVLSIA